MLKTAKTSYLLRGILFLVLGLVCLCTPKGTVTSIAWIAGIALILAGVTTFFLGRRRNESGPGTLLIVAACAMAVAGLGLIVYPGTIAIMAGVFILFEGVEFIVRALRCRKAGYRRWGLILAAGIVVALLGIAAALSPRVGETLISLAIGAGFLGMAAGSFVTLAGISQVEHILGDTRQALSSLADTDTVDAEAEVVE